MVNSLAQVVLKIASPGVPDVYQGTELWDLSLVDPDNRRPVDYDLRRRLLDKVRTASAGEVLAWEDEDGAPKLWLMHRALGVRAQIGDLGGYRPLDASGPHAGNVLAFVRGEETVAVVVPRLVLRLRDGWGDTSVELPAGRWADALGGPEVEGGAVQLSTLLSGFPVALLVRN
jgi:(1->4)-alpha-D-glucan 1-alpha-D-glucosylmutase